jgi:hypothetical protein
MLHGEGTNKAKEWVEKLLHGLRMDRSHES